MSIKLLLCLLTNTEDYSCWLLKNVLLQGHLYLTSKHIAFFAFLPRGPERGLMSGSLQKKSNKTPKFHRYWFVLRDDAFSYFVSSADLYFPTGTIDLRYAIKSEIIAGKNQDKSESKTFMILTESRKYIFRADTPKVAQSWVSALQKKIFRSRNEGDSVKIIIPIANVIDIEKSNAASLVTSLKIRAIEKEESFAVDEYVFAFFTRANDVCQAIKSALKDMGIGKLGDSLSHQGDDSAVARDVHEGIIDSTLTLSTRMGSLKVGSAEDEKALSRSNSSKSLNLMKRIPHIYGSKSPKRSDSGHLTPLISLPAKSPVHSGVQSPLRDFCTPKDSNTAKLSDNVLSLQVGKRLEELAKKDDEGTSKLDNKEMATYSCQPPDAIASVRLNTKNRFAENRAESSDESDEASEEEKDMAAAQRENTSSDEDKAAYDFLSNSESLKYPSAPKKWKGKHHFYTTAMVAKVTEMWEGGRKHFSAPEEPEPYHFDKHYITAEDAAESNARFRAHFSLGDKENLVASYYCHLQKAFPMYGKMYLSSNFLCYRSLLPGVNTKMILPLIDVENVTKESGFRFGYSGLVIVIGGHEEVFFEFGSSENRDDCEMMILRELDRHKKLSSNNFDGVSHVKSVAAPHSPGTSIEARTARFVTQDDKEMEVPVLVPQDEKCELVLGDKDLKALPEGTVFTLLTIGSRGDVQPYIALGKGLMKYNYKVRIATHAEFGPWIKEHGMEFREIAGDPTQLMKIMIDHGMLSVAFIREATTKFRSWIDELLSTAWDACQGTDILVESPSAMAGIHIAEALRIPYYRAFTMPWTRTRAYPHAFIVPEQKMGGSYNYLTYVMFDNVFWKGISSQVNKWRVKSLGIPRTSLVQLHQGSVPFLYCVSPQILVPPVDYSDWVKVTGSWVLDESDKYDPPQDLVDFIARAKEEKQKIVYIGFGSIVVSNPKELTRTVVNSVLKAGVRCILAKGWSDRLGDPNAKETEIEMPPEIYSLKSVPHDWLFPQIDAAVHHGGSGTTGASLRAGLPTVIKPFFADQYFYAGRVEDIGVGIYMKKLTEGQFSRAMWEATHNERIIARAASVGKAIRTEHGVETAIRFIHREIDYCHRIIKKRDEMRESQAEKVGGLLTSAANLVVSGVPHHKSLASALRGRKTKGSSEGSSESNSKFASREPSPHKEDESDKSEQSWTLLSDSQLSTRSNSAAAH